MLRFLTLAVQEPSALRLPLYTPIILTCGPLWSTPAGTPFALNIPSSQPLVICICNHLHALEKLAFDATQLFPFEKMT